MHAVEDQKSYEFNFLSFLEKMDEFIQKYYGRVSGDKELVSLLGSHVTIRTASGYNLRNFPLAYRRSLGEYSQPYSSFDANASNANLEQKPDASTVKQLACILGLGILGVLGFYFVCYAYLYPLLEHHSLQYGVVFWMFSLLAFVTLFMLQPIFSDFFVALPPKFPDPALIVNTHNRKEYQNALRALEEEDAQVEGAGEGQREGQGEGEAHRGGNRSPITYSFDPLQMVPSTIDPRETIETICDLDREFQGEKLESLKRVFVVARLLLLGSSPRFGYTRAVNAAKTKDFDSVQFQFLLVLANRVEEYGTRGASWMRLNHFGNLLEGMVDEEVKGEKALDRLQRLESKVFANNLFRGLSTLVFSAALGMASVWCIKLGLQAVARSPIQLQALLAISGGFLASLSLIALAFGLTYAVWGNWFPAFKKLEYVTIPEFTYVPV